MTSGKEERERGLCRLCCRRRGGAGAKTLDQEVAALVVQGKDIGGGGMGASPPRSVWQDKTGAPLAGAPSCRSPLRFRLGGGPRGGPGGSRLGWLRHCQQRLVGVPGGLAVAAASMHPLSMLMRGCLCCCCRCRTRHHRCRQPAPKASCDSVAIRRAHMPAAVVRRCCLPLGGRGGTAVDDQWSQQQQVQPPRLCCWCCPPVRVCRSECRTSVTATVRHHHHATLSSRPPRPPAGSGHSHSVGRDERPHPLSAPLCLDCTALVCHHDGCHTPRDALTDAAPRCFPVPTSDSPLLGCPTRRDGASAPRSRHLYDALAFRSEIIEKHTSSAATAP